RSSVCSVWAGRPMPRLLPWPSTSSGLSSETAQRTASSTSAGEGGVNVVMDDHLARRSTGPPLRLGLRLSPLSPVLRGRGTQVLRGRDFGEWQFLAPAQRGRGVERSETERGSAPQQP